MSENVVTNEVQTKVAKKHRPVVTSEVFNEFMASGRTAEMTQAEVAEALGMSEGSFQQRLTKYRQPVVAEIKNVETGKTVLPQGVTIEQLKALLPKFKAATRGRAAGSAKPSPMALALGKLLGK